MSGLRSIARERGAMLVQACLAFMGLIALTTFVVDFGILWVAREAAQNSADAGALAGVTALAYDSFTDRSTSGTVVQSALHIAQANKVWDQAPSVSTATDITFPTCPDKSNGCIRVDVYRNVARGNPLPTIFGNIVGITNQSIRATATAEVLPGNASNCLKPWAIVDRWQELSKPPNSTFNPGVDVYIPPSTTSPGTGYNIAQDLGTLFTIKAGSPSGAITTSWYSPIDLPLPPDGSTITGGAQYRTNIETCTGWPVNIGDTLPPENGNMVGPTKQGVDGLVKLDPNAYFDTTTKTVKNSCAPGCAAISPRIVALVVVNPNVLASGAQSGKNIDLLVTNILGFFINGMQGNDVTGYLTRMPGLTIGTPTIGPGSAFLVNPVLIR